MKIISNPKLISRNSKIGLWGQIMGLVLLLGASVLSFQSVEFLGLSLVLFAFGILITQVGIYFGNRWSRRPRPDEHLDKCLKGLDRNYTLYHYRSPIAHLLVGPAGVWALLPRGVKGKVSYSQAKGRWKHRGGGIFRNFGQEGLGKPLQDAAIEISKIEDLLSKNLDGSPPVVQAVLVFTNDEIQVINNKSPIQAFPAIKLKGFIRKQVKVKRLSDDRIRDVNDLLFGD